MQLRDGDLLFSPTDLVNFLGCTHATVLDYQQLSKQPIPRTRSETDQLLAQKGLEHEAAYLQSLKDAGKTVAEIPQGAPTEDQIAMTVEALQAGADIIYQAALHSSQWAGFADFLTKTDQPSDLGPFSYEAIDTKFAKRPKPQHVIQLGVYSDLLTIHQGVAPRQIHVVLDAGQPESFGVSDRCAQTWGA